MDTHHITNTFNTSVQSYITHHDPQSPPLPHHIPEGFKEDTTPTHIVPFHLSTPQPSYDDTEDSSLSEIDTAHHPTFTHPAQPKHQNIKSTKNETSVTFTDPLQYADIPIYDTKAGTQHQYTLTIEQNHAHNALIQSYYNAGYYAGQLNILKRLQHTLT